MSPSAAGQAPQRTDVNAAGAENAADNTAADARLQNLAAVAVVAGDATHRAHRRKSSRPAKAREGGVGDVLVCCCML